MVFKKQDFFSALAEGMSLRYDATSKLLVKTEEIWSFGKLFSKLSAKTEENTEFWQVIYKIICQNQEKYQVLASYFKNYLPKPKKKGIFVYI